MKPHLALTLLTAVSAFAATEAELNNWPSWRGPLASGVAPRATPPVSWDENKNVKWKVAVPGSGSASPIVWNDQIFVLTAIPTGKKVELKAPPAATPPPAPRPAADAGTNSPGRARGGGGGGGGGGRAQVEQPDEEQQFAIIAYDRATGKVRWQQLTFTHKS